MVELLLVANPTLPPSLFFRVDDPVHAGVLEVMPQTFLNRAKWRLNLF
jgi:hypothetical protein